jgi:hypothetical protein
MTLENEDIDAAVAAGVIPQAQADALRAFAAERRRVPLAQSGQEDESFRFMTGFNDFFFAIGILLFGSGIGFFVVGSYSMWPVALAAAIMWGLSELLVRRLRLVLPGILLSVFFIMFVYLAAPPDLFASEPDDTMPGTLAHFLAGSPLAAVTKSLVGIAAAGLYYWRFRLPFALLPIAASLVLAVNALTTLAFGPLSATINSLLGLASGFAVFAVAMTYDISDRDRTTRRADCAFWLHLLAAPLIVHSLVSLITPDVRLLTDNAAIAIILIIAVLAIAAIAIDRRALLVSALLYAGVVIAYAIGGPAASAARSGPDKALVFFSTLVILGAFVIALGVGWVPLRRRLIGLISPLIAGKLPPVPNHT